MLQDNPKDSSGVVSPKSIIYSNGLLDKLLPFSPVSPFGQVGLVGLTNRDSPTSSFELLELLELRKNLLEEYRKKQPFRVAMGKSQWVDYTEFNPAYNLREILNDEIVIEFDTTDGNKAWEGINFTGINLLKAGISFEVWDHEGKSPHLHIHNLPIADLSPDKRALFKKCFIRKYVPLEYLGCVDLSLTGVHLIAIEWANHWKGCYNVKRLLSKFKPMGVEE